METKDGKNIEKMQESDANSTFLRDMPTGCKLCIDGKKSVLFVSGICGKNCYYCPLSDKRKNIDTMWINEAEAKNPDDVYREIDACGSKGIGITGGEPILKPDIVLEYILLLKKKYGEHFHIHMYTGVENIDASILESLKSAGLDELRFHYPGDFSSIKKAIDAGLTVGIEVPVIPGDAAKIKKMMETADKAGVSFINLNELEFSDTNAKELEGKGFILKDRDFFAVDGSEKDAKDILGWASGNTKKIIVHYCSASTKYDYQYWNRLKRRAKNICNKFESITKEGLIKKGVILDANRDDVIKKLKLRDGWYCIKNNRIETTVGNAKLAARRGMKAAIVLEVPTSDAFDMELTPLNKRGREVED